MGLNYVKWIDQKIEKLAKKLPSWLAQPLRWLMGSASRWVRITVGILLIIAGILGIFLPILGVWMIPLGAVLIARDVSLLGR